MDQKALLAFAALSETLHFGRAAERCHMSPSALSRLIQRLEEEAGATLFLRDNRQVRLTAEGTRFLDYARDALRRWESCRQSLAHSGDALSGEVRLFCSVTASYHFLSRMLPVFRERHPHVDIHLHTGDQAESLQRVLSGSVDMAIAAHVDPWPERLAFLPMANTGLVFIRPVTPGSVRDRWQARRRDGWANIPLIVAERGISRQRFDDWSLREGLQTNLYAQVAGHEAIVGMVGLGYGIGVVPELVLVTSPLKDRVVICDGAPQLEPISIGLCCLRRNLGDLRVQAFWDATAAAFAVPGM
ncbi:MAG: HTH-type transcriptional activator IlvY [Gammaproteobacteria bacterium]|nr:MAG: HTH-type transcriptional activator IlvY [Gammaproteobacteria bacterium]